MVTAKNPQRQKQIADEQARIDLEIKNRALIGAPELPASKSSKELARTGALKSGDPTAIAQAKGAILSPQPQVTLEQAQKAQQDLANINQPTTDIQQPSQPKKPLLQTTAQIGLAIPTAIGNALTSGIETITGQKYGRTTTEELAQTPEGKILGNAILTTAIVTGGMYAYEAYLGSLSAQELLNIGGSRLIPSTMRIPALNIFMSHKLLTIAGAEEFFRRETTDAKKAVVDENIAITDVLTDVKNGLKDYPTALQDLNNIEDDINRYESRMNIFEKGDISWWVGGGLDRKVKIRNVRNNLRQARASLPDLARNVILKRTP